MKDIHTASATIKYLLFNKHITRDELSVLIDDYEAIEKGGRSFTLNEYMKLLKKFPFISCKVEYYNHI